MNFIGIIPARYASSRFPGKPLVDIGGKTMIQRVYEQACKACQSVYVATDDERIYQHVHSFEGNVVMTAADHKSGTDRCAEAIRNIEQSTGKTFDVVINVQGDEPFLEKEHLNLIMSCFQNPKAQIATLVREFQNNEDIFNPNFPKVVLNRHKEAIYFSRSPIPYLRNIDRENWLTNHIFYKHIGLYAYTKDILQKITKLPQSTLELAESLEQNRWIENGYSIHVEITNLESVSIDTKEDLKRIFQMGLI
jgi:3-deoxy-manno-octulosonate cytidylyltransferase (CMP-KDO synthetase)